MSTTITKVEEISPLRHDEAMQVAATEYGRFGDLLRDLGDEDWSKPTDCERWDVEAIVSHLLAMCDAFISFRELGRQQRAGKAVAKELGLIKFDGWTEHQARTYTASDGFVTLYENRSERALRRRSRLPGVVRMLRIPSPPYGWFSFAYLLDDILTRDVWMHRVDISRATGRDLVLTPDHDGRFVANIVADLGKRWGQPFTLELEGPAGGTFVHGDGGTERRLDAVELCRILSGRSTGHDLPTDVVPF